MRLLVLALALVASAAWSHPYPAKPVRIVVGFAPGGGTDIISRLLAHKLGERWNQPIVVENKLGASGNIAAELVARSAPDGYTLLMAFSSHASNAAVSKLAFDINKDFSAITLVGSGPALILANPALPAKSLRELIAYAKAHPGEIKYGSSGVGGTVHLAGELMQQLAGIEMVHVPYKGIALAMTAVLAGDIQITYATPISAYQHLKNGRAGCADGRGSRAARLRDRVLVRAPRPGGLTGAAGRSHPARGRGDRARARHEGAAARARLHRRGQQARRAQRAHHPRVRAVG